MQVNSTEGEATEAPMRQPRALLKVPGSSTASEGTDEAVDIVEQLLAGAMPSREQLLIIKSEVQYSLILL